MNPTENEANAASVPVTGSKDGKKTSLKTRAAAVPKMKKSYHSMVVPMRLANATLRDERREGAPRALLAINRVKRKSGQYYIALESAARESVRQTLVHVRAAATRAFVFAGASGPFVDVFLKVRTLLKGLV